MKKAIVNGKVILADRVLERGWVALDGETITGCGTMDEAAAIEGLPALDAGGRIVAPGFVDVHCHGGGGVMAVDSARRTALAHLTRGTTSLLITFAYNEETDRILRGIGETVALMEAGSPPNIAGIHMEGPYINRKYGAQSGKGKDIREVEYSAILREGKGFIRLWTLAPELEGIGPVVDALERAGVVLSVGHSEASPEQIEALVPRGLRNACHVMDAMSVLIPDNGTQLPGVGAAVLMDDRIYTEIIPDDRGVHVHPLVIRLVRRAKGEDKVILITDGTDYSGVSPEFPAEAGTRIEAGVRFVNGEISGSCLTMDEAARNYKKHTGCSWPEVFKAASLNPAAMLGMAGRVGSIAPGKKADLLLMEEDFTVRKVFVDGEEQPR